MGQVSKDLRDGGRVDVRGCGRNGENCGIQNFRGGTRGSW